jgi:hypothetical protein
MKKPDVTCLFTHTHHKQILTGTGSIAKMNFLVMGEAYVIIIVASIPLLNSLVKWGKETITQPSYESSGIAKSKVTIKQSWTVEHEDVENMNPTDQRIKDWV